MDFLNLPSLKTLSVEEAERVYTVSAEAVPPSACAHCGVVGELRGFGRRVQNYADLPSHAKQVVIAVNRRRWQCKACQHITMDPLPDMDEKRDATRRLVGFMQARSLRHTFTSIAEDVGVNEKTVRNVFGDYVAYLDDTVRFETPRVLGIDELHLLGRPRAVFTNIEKRTALGLLEDRDFQSVYRYLMWLPKKTNIEVVTIDMWRPYQSAVRDALGEKIPLVIDKFHVVRMANDGLEQVRKDIKRGPKDGVTLKLMRERHVLLKRESDLTETERLKLEVWLDRYPQLKAAYRLKEDYYKIWDHNNRADAEESYRAWLGAHTLETQAAYGDLIRAMKNWGTEIFNYFDHPVTNAYTESLNNVTRATDRLGRGYSFDIIRAKFLYSKIEFPKPGQIMAHSRYSAVREDFTDYAAQVETLANGSYGVPLSTLREILESTTETPLSTR